MRLSRPICPEHDEACWHPAARHGAEPVEGGRVTPVQIFQDHQEGIRGAQRFEALGEFSEHTIPRGAATPALDLIVLGGRGKAGIWSSQCGAC